MSIADQHPLRHTSRGRGSRALPEPVLPEADPRIEIQYLDNVGEGERPFHYVFFDLASTICPDETNHEADAIVHDALLAELACRPSGYRAVMTPWGEVRFDSESGTFEAHSYDGPEPLLVVCKVIGRLLDEAAVTAG